MDTNENVYVADTNNNRVVKVSKIGGTYGAPVTFVSGLNQPQGVALDGSGDLFILNVGTNQVLEVNVSTPPTLTFATATNDGATDTTDGPLSVQIENVGNEPLTAISPGLSISADFTSVEGSGTPADCTASTSLGPNASCNISVEFKPVAPASGSVNGSAVLTDNNLNANPSTTQTISLAGTATAIPTATQAISSVTLTEGRTVISFTPVTGSGGTASLTYSISPSLPVGLSMNPSTGAITGTPTAILIATTFTVTVTDANGETATNTFILAVNGSVTATVVDASIGLTVNHSASNATPVTGSGGTAPLTYSVSPGLPSGLMFNSSTGAVGGTPTAVSAATSYTVTITDANHATATAKFNLTVNSAVVASVAIASETLTQNRAAAFTPVVATGGTGALTYSVSPGLPAGLMFNSSTGAVSGTPTVVSATTSYLVTATDTDGATATASFTLTVDAAVTATTVIPSTTLTFYQAATAFTPVTGSGGATPLSYSVSPALPAGLSMSSTTGAIMGTPTSVSAAATYMVTVTDTNKATGTAMFSITVNKQPSLTVVSANPTSITLVQSTTLTATVSATIAGTPLTPGGTVTFMDNGTALMSEPVTGGVAQLTTQLPAGASAVITAVYSGDGNFLTSTSTNSVTLVVAPLDFRFTNTGANAYTAAPGAVASYSFAVAPLYGSYAGPMSFTVAGLPAGATASFTPSTVAANSSATTPVMMTVQTAVASAHNRSPFGRGVVLALLLLPFGMKRSVRKKLSGRILLLLLLLAGTTAAMSGCGSSNGFMLQSPQNYTLTVTATAGTLVHSQTVTLIVQ